MHDFASMDRRMLMRSVALLLGAATIPTLAGCKAAMSGDGLLDEAQLKLLTAIADTIIPATDTPGAAAVGVPKLLSGMLANWGSEATKAEVMGAITEIGKLAADGKAFVDLDPAKRKALLLAHDKAAVQPGPPRGPKLTGFAAMVAGPPTMNPAYVRLKGLIIALYYNSEVACTDELVFEPVPGKYVPSMKVTPETRPFAGLGGPF